MPGYLRPFRRLRRPWCHDRTRATGSARILAICRPIYRTNIHHSLHMVVHNISKLTGLLKIGGQKNTYNTQVLAPP